MHFSSVLLLSVLLFASLIVSRVPRKNDFTDPYDYDIIGSAPPSPPLAVNVIHQFPVGTWIDSLAIRNNGRILATALSSPDIFEIDSRGERPINLVHTFTNATGCTGIIHLGRDVFYVIAGNFTLSNLTSVPGSWSIYKVDLRPYHPRINRPARVSLVGNFPGSIFLNRIIVLDRLTKQFLVSDSGAGVVYRFSGWTGVFDKVLEDPLMKPDGPATLGGGISGIRLKEKTNELYFTNRSRNVLAFIFIKNDGTAEGGPAYEVARLDDPDDFVFVDYDNVIVAQNGVDILGRVTGNTTLKLAGGPPNGTEPALFGPTAVRFGKRRYVQERKSDWWKAYISTNGGTAQYLNGNVTRGGTISAVALYTYMSGSWSCHAHLHVAFPHENNC